VFGDTFDIGRFKPGADRFAAPRTLQAIDMAECLFMQFGQQLFNALSLFGL
jgi:hypothetical protein